MNITDLKVPFGIRYISEWKDFSLRGFPHIIDKQIPGCGFTEYCLTNNMDLILVCPRKMILENKRDQHEGQVYYAQSLLFCDPDVDRDITKINKSTAIQESVQESTNEYLRLKSELESWWYRCQGSGIPCKILVTYDSYRKVRGILEELGVYSEFYTVVDEFQSIFVDSRFKSSTELEFMNALAGVQSVCYVSATPMLETYLDQIPEFASLPYYRLDWVALDPSRVAKPALKVFTLKSISSVVKKVVDCYRNDEGETAPMVLPGGEVKLIKSREAVFYMNSVNGIIRSIKAAELLPNEVNILCADTPDNRSRVKRLKYEMKEKGIDLKGLKYEIGKVPLRGQPHKMFTFCTRTVYLGADFYSDNARTWVISDANIESLAVDISLDLPQILGRQRLTDNPWKNQANLYIKTLRSDKVSMDDFKAMIENKKLETSRLLSVYSKVDDLAEQHSLAKKYLSDTESKNYLNDYVAVNKHGASDLVPVYNNLALIAVQRAYDIQQTDYADRFSVFSRLASIVGAEEVNAEILKFQEGFEKEDAFRNRLKYLCEFPFSSEVAKTNILDFLPECYKKFYVALGPEKCRAWGYNHQRLSKVLGEISFDLSTVRKEFLDNFKVGDKYPKSNLKDLVSQIYKRINYTKTPKATDLEDWFEIKACKVKDPSGKWVHGFEIIRVL